MKAKKLAGKKANRLLDCEAVSLSQFAYKFRNNPIESSNYQIVKLSELNF